MALQTKHRPKSFKTFVGSPDVIVSLKSVLKRDNPPSAFLFSGLSGGGKTTLGRIVAHFLGCSKYDYHEYNSADDRGVDGVRRIGEDMKYAPLSGNKKVYLLDECHQITKPAFNALLKFIEEPPEYVHFIFCTTNPEAVPTTIKRRCHQYELSPITVKNAQKLINTVLKREKVDSVPLKVKERIIKLADGSAGQIMKLLDTVIDMTDEELALSVLKSAGSSDAEIINICRTLCNRSMPENTKWARIKEVLKAYKGDGESARRAILGYLSKVLLNNGDITTALMAENFEENFFDSGKAGLILACYRSVFIGE
jgi:DNA polymerase-3 subunit gamma/tau